MRAHRFRHSITIQQVAVTKDGLGGQIKTWSDFRTKVRAEKITSGGREFYAAQKLNADVQVVFRVRYVAGITTKMRVLHEGVEYDILRAADPDGMGRELHISCLTYE